MATKPKQIILVRDGNSRAVETEADAVKLEWEGFVRQGDLSPESATPAELPKPKK